MARARMSKAEPAPSGTQTRTGRVGNSCAAAGIARVAAWHTAARPTASAISLCKVVPPRNIKTFAASCSAPQPFGDARSEVGEHTVRSGALEGNRALHHRLLPVQPAVGRRRHDHRVFT